MMKRSGRHRTLLALVLMVAAAGCAPAFPQEALDRVDRTITFKELQADPSQYQGSWVLLAGVILGTTNTKNGTTIKVLQRPADSDGKPLDTDASAGRFLVESGRFLDPVVYHRGRLISVIGEVAGSRTMPIDEIAYRYPVLDAKALRLWRPSTGPQFFFGIGVSGRM